METVELIIPTNSFFSKSELGGKLSVYISSCPERKNKGALVDAEKSSEP